MMIWLASFPRSGNTFFRIVLSEVYGIESKAYNLGDELPCPDDGNGPLVVKTHLQPSKLPKEYAGFPAVYLVRDGRDSLVSVAHQKKDFVNTGTDFENNLIDSIVAPLGTHFGGWHRNVSEWLDKAEIVIKFEDLIENPIECIEKLRMYIDLPEPNIDRLPTFNDLKQKDFNYGGKNKKLTKEERRDKFFRRGKVGAWQDEMPEYLHSLFWMKSGDVMSRLGYVKPEGLEKISFFKKNLLIFKAYKSLAIIGFRRKFTSVRK
jgi:hypothetical protein